MNSLYWRIFLAFWVAIALILIGTVLVVINAEQQRRFSHSWVQRSELYAQATHAFESGGAEALRAWLRNLQPKQIKALTFITDGDGHEVLGRSIPDYLRDPNYLSDSAGPVSAGKARKILQPTIRPVGGPLVLVGPDGRAFHVIVGPLRAGPHLFGELELPQVSMATLAIALVVSALVCFILARYLVAPVDQLRRATRQIASGDLAVRVSAKLKGRRDELGLLASDLDTMAERVRNLLETKQQLLRDVSHELRSPLTRLQLALSLARRDGDADSARHHERIACEADRLEQLIARTLKLARIERPARGLERLPVNVSELLARIVYDVGIEADAQGCTVDLHSAAGLFVEGDWELLRSALENVIRNAVRYSPPGASVAVSAQLSRGQLEVVVCDGGPGVPEKDLALIFEPFYRVDAARNRAGGGDGLGLAIASRAIALHGGTIDASNVSSGGLAVRMLLPVIHSGAHSPALGHAAPPQTPESAEAQEKAALASGSPTVL